jgi:glutaminyl-peptide cyclotransferase
MKSQKYFYLKWFFCVTIILISFFSPQIGKAKISTPMLLNNSKILQFNSSSAYNILKTQLSFGYRIPGTKDSENCGNYFVSYTNSISPNIAMLTQNFTVLNVSCRNYLIKINPNKSHIIILGAHYDSRAITEKDSDPNPCPGANDGASGVSVLLELCSIFYNKREDLNCTIWILLFDAEDQGNGGIYGWDWCEGSKKFAEDINNYYNPENQTIDAMILLDMVGGTNLEFINELNSNTLLLSELFEIGRDLGYLSSFPQNPVQNAIIDDHLSFNNLGIPSADLIINFWSTSNPWPYHHTISDNIDNISQESLEITGKTIEKFIYNHYLNSPEIENDLGNYPWRNSNGQLNLDVIIYVILIILFIALTISLLIIALRKKKLN